MNIEWVLRAVTGVMGIRNPHHIYSAAVPGEVWRCRWGAEPEVPSCSLHRRDLPGQHPAVLNKLLNQHRILFYSKMKENRMRNRLLYIQVFNKPTLQDISLSEGKESEKAAKPWYY